MAKYECKLNGDFDTFLNRLDYEIKQGSISASFEDGSHFQVGNVRCAVRVYERYSVIGSNRVSMNITLFGNGNDLFLSAITSGGSQAMFFKINTWGEQSFLSTLTKFVEEFKQRS